LYIWTSQILSQVTINILNFIFLIKLFEETSSSIATSFLWVAYAIPAIVVGPIAAALVDMLDRRSILIITNILQALVIFLFALVSHDSLFLLYGVVIAYSFLNQFYVPSEQASLPAVVSLENLPQANGLFFVTQQVALVVGFGAAGFIQHLLGYEGSLYLSTIFLLIAFISVTFLPKMKQEIELASEFEEMFIGFFERIYEGYKFIRKNRVILVPFLLLMGIQISLSIVAVNTPIFATDIFGVEPQLAGIYIVVPAGVGTGIGSLIIPKLLKRQVRKIQIIEHSLMVLTLSLFLLTFLVPELAGIASIAVGFILIVFLGLGFVGVLIPAQTFLQEKTPGGLRGRVFGNYWFLVAIATLIPVVASGTITELLGGRFLSFIMAAGAFSMFAVLKKHGTLLLERNTDFTRHGYYKNGRLSR
jgi:MFS family permease